jgi:hypothetical protein
VQGQAELPAAVGLVVEDVERHGDAARRDADLGQDAGLGHRREAAALHRRRPDHAALGRVGVPVPVLREPGAGPAGAAADRRALGEREELGAAVERRHELGLEPAAEREALQLGGERRVAALRHGEHALAEPAHGIAVAAVGGEEREIRREAAGGAAGELRPGEAPALARIRRVGAYGRERAFRQGRHARRLPRASRRARRR